jgi:glycosyltransferase involved in cell wall biosynthesis
MGIKEDPCHRSMDLLKQLTSKWLESNFQITEPVFIDDNSFFLHGFPDNEIIDIVFFGSHLEKLLRSGNWKKEKFRFWVLSQAVKNIFVEVYGFKEEQVSLIPRYQLFPHGNDHEIGNTYDFIYSGRISPTKNIELLITSFSEIHTNLEKDSKLFIIGHFDNEVLPGAKELPCEYEKALRDLVTNLNFCEKIIFLPAKEPGTWMNNPQFKNPVLINFSNYLHEDFGVSVAQAQSKGWPIVASSWGGHLDLTGSKIFHLPYELFENYHTFFLTGFSLRIASYFDLFFKLDNVNNNEYSVTLPALTSIKEIDVLRKKLFDNFSPHLSLVEEYRHYDFFKTIKGKEYLDLLSKHFAKKSQYTKSSIIIIENQSAIPLANSIISTIELNHSVEVIQLGEIRSHLGYQRLKKSDRIYLICKDTLSEAVLRKDLEKNGVHLEIEVINDQVEECYKLISLLKNHIWLSA